MAKAVTTKSPATSEASFAIFGVLGEGFAAFKKNFGQLFVAAIVSLVVVIFFRAMPAALHNEPALSGIFGLLNFVVSLILSVGWIMIGLNAIRNKEVSLKLFQQPAGKIVKYFLASLLYNFVVFLGFFLFVIPGIYFALRYQFALTLIVDRDAGIADAFAMSAQMTKGMKWSLFGLAIVSVLLNLGGLILIGLGLIITIPTSYLAVFAAYEKLSLKIKKDEIVKQKSAEKKLMLTTFALFIVLAILTAVLAGVFIAKNAGSLMNALNKSNSNTYNTTTISPDSFLATPSASPVDPNAGY